MEGDQDTLNMYVKPIRIFGYDPLYMGFVLLVFTIVSFCFINCCFNPKEPVETTQAKKEN